MTPKVVFFHTPSDFTCYTPAYVILYLWVCAISQLHSIVQAQNKSLFYYSFPHSGLIMHKRKTVGEEPAAQSTSKKARIRVAYKG